MPCLTLLETRLQRVQTHQQQWRRRCAEQQQQARSCQARLDALAITCQALQQRLQQLEQERGLTNLSCLRRRQQQLAQIGLQLSRQRDAQGMLAQQLASIRETQWATAAEGRALASKERLLQQRWQRRQRLADARCEARQIEEGVSCKSGR